MLALQPTGNDVGFKVTRNVTRPVWEPDSKTMALYAHAAGIALHELSPQQASLEEVFMELTSDSVDFHGHARVGVAS